MSSLLRFTRPFARSAVVARPFSTTSVRAAHEGYGGTTEPQRDVPSSQKTRDKEHPGPPSPAQKSNSSSTRKQPEDASAQSGGARSKDAKETGSSPTGGEIKKN